MRELLDSSDVLADRAALLERFREDGYLFLRGLLDPETVGNVRADILRAVSGVGWTEAGRDPLEAVPSSGAQSEGDPGWWAGYRAIQSLESFHRLAHDERIVRTLGLLFDEDVIVHPEKITRVILPNRPGGTTPPHQDFPNIGGTLDIFTVWLPLADVPKVHGGLAILPGSHREGLRHVTIDVAQRGAAAIYLDGVSRDDPAWSTADYRAGDALIFHSLTVHSGLPNSAERIRISTDFRYQPVSEPIAEIALRPHFFQRGLALDDIPPWSEFTAGWSSDAWHQVPPATRSIAATMPLLTNAIGPHAGARNGMSRFLDTTAFAVQAAEQRPFVTRLPVPSRVTDEPGAH